MDRVGILYLVVISLLFSSCATLYLPNSANVPLHKEKDELQLHADVGMTGVNLQSSYSVTNHVMIALNGFLYDSKERDNDFTKNRVIETAAGYFKTFDNNILVFEGQVGYGIAFAEDKESQSSLPIHIKTNYQKLFLQPSIGVRTDYFDAAFTPRFSMLNYFNFRDIITASENRNIYPGILPYFEPIITVRGGYKFIKIQIQTGFSLALNTKHPLAVQGWPLILNFGLSSHIPFRKKTANTNL
jgi:hypothetical protein